MIDANTVLNTCYETTSSSRVIASYSHIIPVVLSLILGIFVLIKAKFNFLSKIFLAFIAIFSLWLIGDYIIWTKDNYFLIYASWAPLDYIEILFYVLGLYFATLFVRKNDITIWWKILLFSLTLPAFFITVLQNSVTGFNYPVCEAYNNEFLGNYKLAVEGFILMMILIYAITPFFKKFSWGQIRNNLVVLGSMFLFLSIFGITEYLASVTGYYEMNLYSLFLLPVFLVAIIYSVFELDIFNVKLLGTHYLVVGLVILMSGQLFFITDSTNRLLTILTLVLLAGLSIILFRNLKRESDQRIYIAHLNENLKTLIKQRESLVHLVTHKVKGSFTRTKFIFAGILDGTYGEISPTIKKIAEQGLDFDNGGIETVDLVLNVANMQNGLIKYDMKKVDFKELVEKTLSEKKGAAEKKGLKIESEIKEGFYNVTGDAFWLKEVINNLVDNAIKYTKEGTIIARLEDGNGKVKFSVKDTGVGITDEDKKNLFKEGGRGKDSVKINVDSTGYGLYTVKLVMDAHKGQVGVSSEGPNKGSTFFVEMDATDR